MKLQVKGAFKNHSFLSTKSRKALAYIFLCVVVTLILYFKIPLCSSAPFFPKYFLNTKTKLRKLPVKMVSFTTLLLLQDQGQRYIFL